jgi:Carboxypeptidase regulatory-like domain
VIKINTIFTEISSYAIYASQPQSHRDFIYNKLRPFISDRRSGMFGLRRLGARYFCLIITALAGISLTCVDATAQTITGTISGTVVDKSGAVVPAVAVTLVNEGTGAVRTTESNDTGAFVFNSVPVGTYTVKLEKTGFKRFERTKLELTSTQRLALGELELALGEVSDTVTVAAQGEAVSTESSERYGLLNEQQLDLLIARGRDPISLIKVMPGVSQVTFVPWGEADEKSLQTGNQSLGGQFGTFTPNIQGVRSYFNNFSLDGQPGGDTDIEGLFNEVSSIDSVGEMKAVLTNYAAEYGRNPGPVVNMVTKSGTKDFHGSVGWFKRHEKLNANEFFNNRDGIPKPIYRHGIFGFNVGGPVFIPGKFNQNKDKVFFFFSDENWRITQPTGLRRFTVPTELERRGDFSQSLDQDGKLIPVIDPLTKQPFPGNIIPSDRINQNGQALLNLQPLPTQLNRSQTFGAYNYEWQDSLEVPKNFQILRLDFHPSGKDSFYVRARRWNTNTRAFEAGACFGGGLPLARCHYLFTDDSAQVGYTRVISPTVVNEFNIGMRGLKEIGAPESANEYDAVTRSKQGVTLGQLYPEANPLGLIPQMTFGGVPSAAAFTFDTRTPIDAGDQRVNISNNFSLIRGSHNPKFGIYFEHTDTSEGHRTNVSYSGAFDFGRDPNNPLDTGYAYSNALLGNFRLYNEATNVSVDKGRNNIFEWFAQDTWKATRRLTLNYGVRFSRISPFLLRGRSTGAAFVPGRYDPSKAPALFRPALDATGKRQAQNPITGQFLPEVFIGAFVPGSGDPVNGMVLSTDSSYPDGFRDRPPIQVGPRFGFAYDLFGNGKTAVRGGFASTKQTVTSSQQYLWGVTTAPPVQFSPQIFYGNMDTLLGSSGVLFPSPVTAIQKDSKAATVYSYSLGVQHQIGANTVVDISYVGNTGRHYIQTRNLNTIAPGARFDPANIDPTTGGALPPDFFRPYPGYGDINYVETPGISNYNSLQFSANRRFTNGPQFGVSYTWSKSMDLTDGDGDPLPLYLSARSRLYGRAGYDQTHMLSINYIWDLPKASKVWPNPFVRTVLDNWQLSGITTFASGLPRGIDFSTTDNADITGGGDPLRVDLVGSPQLSHGERTFTRWFNTAAFARPAQGTFGNAAKDLFRGPGLNNWDMTVYRKFPIGSEQRYIQFRTELYNAFNHTQFQFVDNSARFDPAGNQVNGRFGQVVAARQPRVIQFAISFYF